jgi:hypothetical protein
MFIYSRRPADRICFSLVKWIEYGKSQHMLWRAAGTRKGKNMAGASGAVQAAM